MNTDDLIFDVLFLYYKCILFCSELVFGLFGVTQSLLGVFSFIWVTAASDGTRQWLILDDNPNLGFGVSGGLLPLEKTLTGSQILLSSLLNHTSMWCSDMTVFIQLLHKQNILEYCVFLQHVPLTLCVVSYMDQDILILQFKSQKKKNYQPFGLMSLMKDWNHPRKGSPNFKCTWSCSQYQRLN